jgi:signal transduction histidine kinase
MKIRTKLSITFILLLIFGVTAISSYAIVFIRGYLLEQAIQNLRQDALWMAFTLEGAGEGFDDQLRMARISGISGYHIAVYDLSGSLLAEYPESDDFPSPPLTDSLIAAMNLSPGSLLVDNRREADYVSVFTPLQMNGPTSENALPGQELRSYDRSYGGIVRISSLKESIYEPVKTIRWIIYTGMFISIGLILIVSFTFARYMARPITQLTDASRRIAAGEVDQKIELNRGDEFGILADSINQMASTLRADNEQLKMIYERQQDFIADIAHEIRNPLHTIMGSIEMLELDNLPDEKRRNYLANTRNQTERISSLFKDLILLQRSASDVHFLTPRVFDLSSVAIRVENAYKDRFFGKDIEFKVGKQFCKVYGDPERIEQVLDNLLSNAEKYTPRGYIRLAYTDQGDKVRISVEDSGIGIAEEHLPYLFNRFYRTDKARSRDSGGAGLGLAVVKSILDAHGSTIHVESKPGKGTQIWFELSRRPAVEQETP